KKAYRELHEATRKLIDVLENKQATEQQIEMAKNELSKAQENAKKESNPSWWNKIRKALTIKHKFRYFTYGAIIASVYLTARRYLVKSVTPTIIRNVNIYHIVISSETPPKINLTLYIICGILLVLIAVAGYYHFCR